MGKLDTRESQHFSFIGEIKKTRKLWDFGGFQSPKLMKKKVRISIFLYLVFSAWPEIYKNE
jgi:hypothetical protein